MFSSFRNRFGIPGAISAIALVFAMLGGAYAASNDNGKASASAKAKRGPRGPKGPAGPAGPQGPAGANGKDGAAGSQGSVGPQGPVGSAGAKGATGAAGSPGEDGKSVEALTIDPGEPECEGQGGAEYTVEESGEFTTVCNGKDGAEGSPWTAGGELPPGATEVSTWAFTATSDQAELGIFAPVSFSIPLNLDTLVSVEEGHIGVKSDVISDPHCPGPTGGLNPKAAPGYVCVYPSFSLANTSLAVPPVEKFPFFEAGVNRSGAIVHLEPNENPAELALGAGTVAITGCSTSLTVGNPNKCPE